MNATQPLICRSRSRACIAIGLPGENILKDQKSGIHVRKCKLACCLYKNCLYFTCIKTYCVCKIKKKTLQLFAALLFYGYFRNLPRLLSRFSYFQRFQINTFIIQLKKNLRKKRKSYHDTRDKQYYVNELRKEKSHCQALWSFMDGLSEMAQQSFNPGSRVASR